MEERRSPQPAGYLLSRFGLVVVLAGLVLAAWFGEIIIVTILGLVLSAAGLSKLWSRYSLAGVGYECGLDERRIFPGESVELKLRLVNRKLLPLPWIQLDYEMPVGLSPGISLNPGDRPEYGFLSKSTALLWYSGVSWRERLYGEKRGYYRLGPVTLTSGDIFGFYPRHSSGEETDNIIVYPNIFPVARLQIPPQYPIGDTVDARRIFEDPMRVNGVRDYSPHDGLRRIHWKASARHQNLKVKVYEPTTTLKVALFMAVDSFPHEKPEDESMFELGISAAASVASYLLEQHTSVGLFANSCLADTEQPVEIPPGSSTGQMVELLEALAKVTPTSSGPFEEFVRSEPAGLQWGTTLVFVLARPSTSLNGLLLDLRESGYQLMVLQIGDKGENGIGPGIVRYIVTKPGDLMEIGGERE